MNYIWICAAGLVNGVYNVHRVSLYYFQILYCKVMKI